jgi:hypothetical protein
MPLTKATQNVILPNICTTDTAQTITGAKSITATGSSASITLQNRFAEGLTPKDFGADPSLPNNTTAIQNWLDSGGNLQGTAGTYAVTSTLTIPNDNTIINGNGMEITYNTSSRTSVIAAINRSHITINNLKINGRKDLKTPTGVHRAYGFDFQNCSNVIVDGCYVQNTIEHGIRVGIAESLTAAISRNIKIVNNTVFDCGNSIIGRGAGIWLYGLVNDFVISSNIVIECPVSGIFVDDSHSLPNLDILRGNVTGNVVTISTVYSFRNIGIGFSGNRDICFTGNISSGYKDAFSFTSVQARTQSGFSQISGNYFEGLLVGARLRNLQYVNFSSNTVRTTASVGADDICINAYSDDSFDADSYLKSIKISNNLVYAYRKGISINEQAGSSLWADDITIDSNRVEYIGPTPPASSVIDGITIQKTTGNSREGRVNTINNVVSKFYDGIYYDPETPTYCIGNLVTDCAAFGIRTNNGTFALIARNTCRNNAGADFSVSTTGNVATTVFKDNEAFSTTKIDQPAIPATTKQNNLGF